MKSAPFSPPGLAAQTMGFVVWLLVCFAAPALGAFSLPGEWYAALKKPSWNPPAWIFGPVWTLLYTLMAVAAWLVWRQDSLKARRGPLTFFLAQLLCNALWTPLFFGLHRPDLAFADIVLLWLALLGTVIAFWRVRALAGAMLLPYLAWVTFAAVLNFTLWQLNP
jgi:translocator protein